MPIFGLVNFAGLFSFFLLTFVCRTPIITQDISYNTRDLVIDLGNSVPHPDRLNCPYVNRIGQLTVSILLNRFAKKESVYFTQKPIPLPHEIFKDGENNSNLERS